MTHVHPDLAWIGLLALGAIHGINPAMGWLFAVSLGLQERSRAAIWQALGPLALGHALAIAAALAVAAAVGLVVPLSLLKWVVATMLVLVGLAHLRRHVHPRGAGMRVGAKDLTIWSFLMASAHGAGLMALPFVLAWTGSGPGVGAAEVAPTSSSSSAGVLAATGTPADAWIGLAGTALHTVGYLLVTGLVAVAIYEWLGLRLLRTAWVNLDLLWAAALVATGVLTPFL